MSLGIALFELCGELQRPLNDRYSASGICSCVLLWFNFLESSAVLTELSFLTGITTGLTNKSSGHFSSLIICSGSTFSSKCSGTPRPFCWFGIWFCLNIDLAIWFFSFSYCCTKMWVFFVYPFFLFLC